MGMGRLATRTREGCAQAQAQGEGWSMADSLRAIFFGVDYETPLPCGWEKCLDITSGHVYYKDLNTGTSTYQDPRKKSPSSGRNSSIYSSPRYIAYQRKGVEEQMKQIRGALLELSDQSSQKLSSSNLDLDLKLENACVPPAKASLEEVKKTLGGKRERQNCLGFIEGDALEQALFGKHASEAGVCTVEKVQSALERSKLGIPKPAPSFAKSGLSSLNFLSLNLPSPQCPESSRSERESYDCGSPSSSFSVSSSSQSSSASVMSFQCLEPTATNSELKDDSCSLERQDGAVLVALGCQKCLMFMMLSKGNPCPKCGSTTLLEIHPRPELKRQRI